MIHLRLDRGLRNREIARFLDISEGTVENQITRGFAQCREYMGARGLLKRKSANLQPTAGGQRSMLCLRLSGIRPSRTDSVV